MWNDGLLATSNVYMHHKITDDAKAQFRIVNETDAAFHHGHVIMWLHVPNFLQVGISTYDHRVPDRKYKQPKWNCVSLATEML